MEKTRPSTFLRLAAAVAWTFLPAMAVADDALGHMKDVESVFARVEGDSFRDVFEKISYDMDNTLPESFRKRFGPVPGNHRILGHSWALGDKMPKDVLRVLDNAYPGRKGEILRWWNEFAENEIDEIARKTGLSRSQAKWFGNIVWRIHLFGDCKPGNKRVDRVLPTRENAERLIRDLKNLFGRTCPAEFRNAENAIRTAMAAATEPERAIALLDALKKAHLSEMLDRSCGSELASKGIRLSVPSSAAVRPSVAGTGAGSVPSSAAKLMAKGRTFAADSAEGAKAWSAAKEGFRSKGTVQVRPGILAPSGRLLVSLKSGAAAGALVFAADAGMACYRYWQGDILDIELADGIADAALKGAVVGAAVGVAVLLGATPYGWCVLAVATATYIIVDVGIRIWREIDERRFLSAEDLSAFGIRPDAFPEPRDTILSPMDDGFLEPRDSTLVLP